MPKATIRDIARRAGASTATVDRALNGRPGVSAANRQRILSAARDLGYLPSEGMVILPSRPARLEFFVPATGNAFMADLITSLEAVSATLPLVQTCRITRLEGIGPDHLIPALERVNLGTDGVGLIATDHAETRRAVDDLVGAGVRVVTLASDLPETLRHAHVGLDDHVAGRTAGQLMTLALPQAPCDVAVFLGSPDYRGHAAREAGFTAVIGERHRLLPPIETGDTSSAAQQAALDLLKGPTPPKGIYCIGAGRAGVAEALRHCAPDRRPFVVMHDLTSGSATWLREGLIAAVIDQNARLVGEQAVIRLLGAIAAQTPFLPLQPIEPRIILRENLPSDQ